MVLTMSHLSVCSVFVDGDIFGHVSKLGRDAAEGVARAVHGEPWDDFLAARCLEVLISKADGIKALLAVVDILRGLQSAPLLAPTMIERAVESVGDAVRTARGTILDLMLRSVAQRCILQGEHEPRRVLSQLCVELLDRAILSGQGGFLELELGGRARRNQALSILARVAAQAAACLEARPDAKRLGLTRQHAQLEADTDLLGVAP